MNKDKKSNKNSKAQYMPIGLCLGLAIGAAFDNIPMGMCIGLGIGAAIDILRNKKKNDSKSDDAHEE